MLPRALTRVVRIPSVWRQIVHNHQVHCGRTAALRGRSSCSIVNFSTAKYEINLCADCSRYQSDTNSRLGLLLGGFLGLFGFHDEKDEEGKVPQSVKRELLKAQKAHSNGDYSTADQCYHSALHLLSSTEHAQNQTYLEAKAVTMDKLANLYLEQKKYRQAEATFKETLRLIVIATGSENGTDEQEAMIEISLKLSKIYANQTRYKEADIGFQWCVESAKKCLDKNRTKDHLALLGICYESQGKYLMMIGKSQDSLLAYGEAKKIAAELFKKNSLQYATLLTDEAATFLSLGRPAQAEQLLQESLHIMETLSGSQAAQNMAVTSYNLAMVLAMKDTTDPKTEIYLRKSISLLEALKDETMLEDLELYYYKLGTVLISQGRVEDARRALKKAKVIASKTGNSVLLEHILQAINSQIQNGQ